MSYHRKSPLARTIETGAKGFYLLILATCLILILVKLMVLLFE